MDTKKRIEQHNAGKGAKYTNAHKPVTLVYREKCSSKSTALKREFEIKKWSKQKKEELIRNS